MNTQAYLPAAPRRYLTVEEEGIAATSDLPTVRRVLFVDDEPNVLAGLQRMLRPMRQVWEMRFVTGQESGAAAVRANRRHGGTTQTAWRPLRQADRRER
jgi:hypothetical protein